MTTATAKIEGPNKTVPRAANAGTTASKELSSLTRSQDIPYGFCHCGCGEKTRIAAHTDRRDGRVKGEPIRFIHNHHTRRVAVEYLEEDRGYATACWIWQRFIDRDGYARANVRGPGSNMAHRQYYEREKGPIPDGLHLDHLCRVRCCVNPDHLEPVTNAENQRRGDRTTLTASHVAEIKARLALGKSCVDLASEYGVAPPTIQHIKSGYSWKDIEAT